MKEQSKSKAGVVKRLKKDFDEMALWVGLLFIVALISAAFYNIKSNAERNDWVTHTYVVLQEADALISAMKDAETGQRGFILTGDQAYLEPYEKAGDLAGNAFNRLMLLTADNPEQQRRLQEIDKRIKLKFAELDQTIRLRKEAGFEAALEVVRTDKGKKVMDEFRQLLSDFQKNENKLLLARTEASNASTTLAMVIQGVGGLLVVVYLGFALLSIRRQKKSRRALFLALDGNNKDYLLNNGKALEDEQEVIQSLVQNLQSTKEFIRKIGNKEFDAALEGLQQEHYELNKTNMAGALLEVRSLLKNNEKEEGIRRWVNEGLARFSDLIRQNSQSLDVLANECLQSLVKYLKVNQGALYVVGEEATEEPYMEVVACYAWNKKKFIHSRIHKGEGLAGQAWQEMDTLYLTDVPNNYVKITSGLGGANPNCILIVPLKNNEEVLGVLELASFQPLEEFEIKFVERIAETLAAALNGTKVNERTRRLLEESQTLAEQMRAQEEEMRQNMEELEATQEEMRRSEIEMRGQFTAINNTMATIEFDMHGNIRTANDSFRKSLGYSQEEMKGRHHRMFCEASYAASSDYVDFWEKLHQGISVSGTFKQISKKGTEVWLNATYTPISDTNGTPYKVIKLAFDITQDKQRILALQQELEASRELQHEMASA